MKINMKKFDDRKLWRVLLSLFIFSMMLPVGYMLFLKVVEGNPYVCTEDMARKATVDGYETPEEVTEYVLYWIQQDDLDLALRGCAIEEVADYFSLQAYCEVLDKYPKLSTAIAPAEGDSKAYTGINRVRMTAVYSDMLEQCMGIMGSGYEVDILNIYSDIPEDADGFYYQEIRDVCSIVGARDVCNVVAEMTVDGIPRQMTVTAARYKQHWKIIQFSAYKNYKYVEPQISEFIDLKSASELPIEWETMDKQVLPCNYWIIADHSEEDIELLIQRWFLYMQRGDIAKALAYWDIYDSGTELYPDSIFFSKQSYAAERMQKFYYDLLLFDKDSTSWIKQNPKEEAFNLVNLLNTNSMIYTKLGSIKMMDEEEGYARYWGHYTYSRQSFRFEVELTYRDGWKITRVQRK